MGDGPCRLFLTTRIEDGAAGRVVLHRQQVGGIHLNVDAANRALQEYYDAHGGPNAVLRNGGYTGIMYERVG